MTDRQPFHNPFAALAGLRDTLPAAPADERLETPSPDGAARPAAGSTAGGPAGRGPARAVVRIERSGRGGKAVTVIEHLDLPSAEREVWVRALKATLGCGGSVEGEALVLQGDQRSRLPALLTARGVRKVTVA